MSRCFPFPPPGYQKKDKAEDIDLLKKEKRKEKKHKKDKRDKGKGEHKDKKDKERSKDKHKEKKDRKEKHKEKKKDRDKGSTSEDRRALEGIEGHNKLHNRESHQRGEGNGFKFTKELGRRMQDDGSAIRLLGSFSNSIHRKFEGVDVASSYLESHPSGEVKDSKFTEELGRRTHDDGATSRLLGNSSNSIHRSFGAVNIASSSQEKERFADNKALGNQISSAQRRNDENSWPTENVTSSLQKNTGNISITTTVEKERGKIPDKFTVGRIAEQYSNHGISKPTDDLVHRKMEGSNIIAGMEKEKYSEKCIFSNATAPILEKEKLGAKFASLNHISATNRKNDVLGRSVENLLANSKSSVIGASSFHNCRTDAMGTIPAMENEGAIGNEISTFPFLVGSEQRTNAVGQPAEKDRYQKIERKEKVENKKAQEKERHKDQDHYDKKFKVKDKDRQTKEKKKDSKDHVDIKPLGPHKENKPAIGVDVTTKKRKFLETNGLLHENDAKPGKLPWMATSSHLQVNGRILEASNNLKPDFHLENKINGTTKSQQLPTESKPEVTGVLTEIGEVPLKSPHPDSKFLSIIYNVPKMDDSPEFDDQDWLLNSRDSRRKPKVDLEAKETPPVWSEALRIDSTDDFALPYVVPF